MSSCICTQTIKPFAISVFFGISMIAAAQTDPGIRAGGISATSASAGTAGAGAAIPGLTVKEAKFFSAGRDAFAEVASVRGTISGTEPGLGPRFNLTSCAGCHAFPAIGGASPKDNPQVVGDVAPANQVALLTGLGMIAANGPVREARFVFNDPVAKTSRDGGVHDLFTIMGRPDTPRGCNISQPDFSTHILANNVIFRIPTPTFGLGLIEAIADSTILSREGIAKPFGIGGHANRNGNDGSVSRYGWKAQNKSLVIFSGEAYNVEQGVSNDLFPDERGEGGVQDPTACRVNPTPEDKTHYDETQPQSVPSDAVAFANFMKFLAPPQPVPAYTSATVGAVSATSINNGRIQFSVIGCAVCHTPSISTGTHSSPALANKTVNLYSDLLVHDMGRALADGVAQGNAGFSEFRTAPLWGLGERIFLLHDGRTSELGAAIAAHGGEAARVAGNFAGLSAAQKQDLLNFLRSL